MTYRYIGTLAEEAASMHTAYSLRSGNGIEMRHMGSFCGQLLLRSFDRAERIYNAMNCRGYAMHYAAKSGNLKIVDFIFIAAVCGISIIFRLNNIPVIIGGLFNA